MVSINPIDRWPSSRITVKMLTGAPQSTCFGSRGSPVRIRAPRLEKMKPYKVFRPCGALSRQGH